MSLTGNALVAHDQDYAVGQALATLRTKINAALDVMGGISEIADSYNRIHALSEALRPVEQAVIDAMNSYVEAGNSNH